MNCTHINNTPIPKKYQPRIDEIEERFEPGKPGGYDYWVYLKDGWLTYDGETHTIHEDTIAEVLWNLRHTVPEEEA